MSTVFLLSFGLLVVHIADELLAIVLIRVSSHLTLSNMGSDSTSILISLATSRVQVRYHTSCSHVKPRSVALLVSTSIVCKIYTISYGGSFARSFPTVNIYIHRGLNFSYTSKSRLHGVVRQL